MNKTTISNVLYFVVFVLIVLLVVQAFKLGANHSCKVSGGTGLVKGTFRCYTPEQYDWRCIQYLVNETIEVGT